MHLPLLYQVKYYPALQNPASYLMSHLLFLPEKFQLKVFKKKKGQGERKTTQILSFSSRVGKRDISQPFSRWCLCPRHLAKEDIVQSKWFQLELIFSCKMNVLPFRMLCPALCLQRKAICASRVII